MNDLDEQAWWVFQMPASTVSVPAATEQAARSVLARHCYPTAPVDAWPLIRTRVASRRAVAETNA